MHSLGPGAADNVYTAGRPLQGNCAEDAHRPKSVEQSPFLDDVRSSAVVRRRVRMTPPRPNGGKSRPWQWDKCGTGPHHDSPKRPLIRSPSIGDRTVTLPTKDRSGRWATGRSAMMRYPTGRINAPVRAAIRRSERPRETLRPAVRGRAVSTSRDEPGRTAAGSGRPAR